MKPESTPDQNPLTLGDKPLTAGQIATHLRRSRWGVKQALDRLSIAPELELGGIRYYPVSAVPTLEEAMRQP